MSHKNNGASETKGRVEKTIAKPADDVPFQPVYFLSLDVENFRCFGPKQTLNLTTDNGRPAQWTVILGVNGVGKTTLLRLTADFQPVAWQDPLQDGSAQGTYSEPRFYSDASFPNSAGRISEARRNRKDDVSLSASYWLGGFESHNKAELKNLRVSFYKPNSETVANCVVGDAELSSMICYGYGANRRTGKSNLSNIRDDDDNCASLFDDEFELLNAEEWLLQADYAANRNSPLRQQAETQRDRIKEILIRLLPDIEEIRIAEGENHFDSPEVEFKTPYGWVRLQSLSLGYRALITWMVDLASRLFDRYPDSPDPLAEPAVVLVDEIDLHLHPRWQRTLMQFLSDIFKQTQFIVTAHSPLVVQAADENANIVLLRREGDHVVIENDVKTIRGWRVDQILTSDLFGLETARPPQYDELIKERTALLSKGRLTKKDETRLAELEKQMDELPTGETPSDMEAMDIIRQAAELLKAK